MKIVRASHEILTPLNGTEILRRIEAIGRTSYKSEDKTRFNTAKDFVERLIANGHESVLEHESVSVRFIVDRGTSHEIVRHRLASYTQESTRYCNYSLDKFGNEITVIAPISLLEGSAEYSIWKRACEQAEVAYFGLLECGAPPQVARSVLPTCLKTEIVVTANLREWRHIFRLRCTKNAHPDIRSAMRDCFSDMNRALPVIFGDIMDELVTYDDAGKLVWA